MHALTLGSFIFFTALVGVLTWWLTRRDQIGTSEGYFLGGRALTGGYIAGSLLLTNLSTEQLVGLNGDAFRDGICVMAWEVIAAFSLVVMALFFLPRYLKSGIATIPEFLQLRFSDRTRTITTIIFLVAYTVILLPMILYTGATGLNGILDMKALTGLPSDTSVLWFSVWMIGIIGSIYAIFGGLRMVAVSDTLNGFGLLTGGLLITFLGLRAINPDPLAALSELKQAHPEKFNSLGGANQSVPFATLFTGVLLLNLFYWCTNQQIIQRAFAATNLKEGQKGVLLAGVFKLLAPLILVLPGVIAFHLYAGEGIKPVHAYGTLVSRVLPPWLSGFFAATLVGAILSSFNSVLNSSCTLYSLGVYQHFLRPQATEAEVIRSGRTFGLIIALLSMCAAPALAGQESIFGYLQKMNGLYFIPIFAVTLVGILSRRVPAVAADAALLVGVAAISMGYFVPAAATALESIHGFHFLGIVFISLIALMLVIGAIAPRETPWEQQNTLQVDLTPWRFAQPVGVVLIAIVLTLYVSLADWSVVGKDLPPAAATAGR